MSLFKIPFTLPPPSVAAPKPGTAEAGCGVPGGVVANIEDWDSSKECAWSDPVTVGSGDNGGSVGKIFSGTGIGGGSEVSGVG